MLMPDAIALLGPHAMLTTRTGEPCSACGCVFTRERFDGKQILIVCLLCGRPAERSKPAAPASAERPSSAELAVLQRSLRQPRAATK